MEPTEFGWARLVIQPEGVVVTVPIFSINMLVNFHRALFKCSEVCWNELAHGRQFDVPCAE